MEGRKGNQPRSLGTRGKTPAERSVEYAETQRKLKEEAGQRREAAAKRAADEAKKKKKG